MISFSRWFIILLFITSGHTVSLHFKKQAPAQSQTLPFPLQYSWVWDCRSWDLYWQFIPYEGRSITNFFLLVPALHQSKKEYKKSTNRLRKSFFGSCFFLRFPHLLALHLHSIWWPRIWNRKKENNPGPYSSYYRLFTSSKFVSYDQWRWTDSKKITFDTL